MSQSQWEAMLAHVKACAPREGCGLLAGMGEKVADVLPIPNIEQNPKRFQMDPAEQLRAFNSMEERGLELLGIFHSHPADPGPGAAPAKRPSPSDIREAAYPAVYVIWSRDRAGWRAHGYWIENQMASEVLLQVSADQ